MIRFAWKPSVISCRKTASCFSDRHNRSMKILSSYRHRLSIDIFMSALAKVVIQPEPVYWLPWSVFIISGLPYRAIVFSNASTPQRLNASTPQRLNAKAGIERIGKPPGQNLMGRPVHNCHLCARGLFRQCEVEL